MSPKLLDVQGDTVVCKRMNRKQLVSYMSNLELCLVCMEACGAWEKGTLPFYDKKE